LTWGGEVTSVTFDPNSRNKTAVIPVKAEASEFLEECIWTGIKIMMWVSILGPENLLVSRASLGISLPKTTDRAHVVD
jgi:hypothetical protein